MVTYAPEKTHNESEFERIRWEELSLYEFVHEFWPVIEPGKPFVEGKHIQAICIHLEAVFYGKILRVVVNMPPRFAKSSIISVLFRVWCWVKKPSLRFLCASYALSLATRDNVKCRRLILSAKFQQCYGHLFTLTKDQNAKIKFENDRYGASQAVSVGSSATGEGFDIGIIDDPHSIDETRSDVTREATLEWFKDTWCTRLNDQQTSAMIVVGQRVHSQDLSGYILSGETGEHWVHLNLATEYEPTYKCITYLPSGEKFWEDWRKVEGELLWPERFPLSVVERAKRRHGSFAFAALYQQSPMPSDGGIFKKQWFRYFTETPTAYTLHKSSGTTSILKSACWRFTVVDLAISSKQTADYTVIQTYDVTPENDLLLIDQIRDRLDNPEQVKALKMIHARLRPMFMKVESVAYQLALVQQLKRLAIPVKEYKPTRDKVSRASVAAILMENEKFFFREGDPYLLVLEPELLMFPLGAHDDQIDDLSAAGDELGMPRKIGGILTTNKSDDEDAKEEENDSYVEEEQFAWP